MIPTRSARSSRRRRASESAAFAAILASLAPVLALVSACASTAPRQRRDLPPAGDVLKGRVLAAWDAALRRADSMGPSRILYDAKFGKGVAKLPGTLAVTAGPGFLTVKASGPFGVEVGTYEDGTYTGRGGEASFLEPTVLRGVLAGVWRGGPPVVAGADGQEGLLRWQAAGGVIAEGLLNLSGERLESLEVRSDRGELSAQFSGVFDPWPQVIFLQDRKTGRSLKLKRVTIEPIKEQF